MQIHRRLLLSAGVAAIASSAIPTTAAVRALKLTSPIKTGAATVDAQGCVAYPDTIVPASSSFVLAGTYTGEFKNIMIAVPGVSPWGSVVQDGKGGWTSTMDLSGVRTGPLNCRIMAWYDDVTEKVVHLDFTLLIDNPAIQRAALPVPALAAGMKQLLADDFDTPPDNSRWAFGVRPDGSQWGSGSHFMEKNEKLSDVFQVPMPSCLRVRAVYDDAYVDPQKWGAQMAVRPALHGLRGRESPDSGVPQKATLRYGPCCRLAKACGRACGPRPWAQTVRVTKRMALRSTDSRHTTNSLTLVTTLSRATSSLWVGNGKNDGVNRQTFSNRLDATSDWHVYGALVEDTQATFYIDGRLMHKIEIPASGSKSPLYWMFDNALSSGDWPIVVPPARYVDMWIDYIRIYSGD